MKKYAICMALLTSLSMTIHAKDLCLKATSNGNPDLYVKYKGVKSLKKQHSIVPLNGIILGWPPYPIMPLSDTAVVMDDGSITYTLFGARVTGADVNLAGGLWEASVPDYVITSIDCKTFPDY